MKTIVLYNLFFIHLGLCFYHSRAIRSPIPDIPSNDPLGQCYDRLRDKEADLEICYQDNDRFRKDAQWHQDALAKAQKDLERCWEVRGEYQELVASLHNQLYSANQINQNLYNIVADLRLRIGRLEDERTQRGVSPDRCRPTHDEMKKKEKKDAGEEKHNSTRPLIFHKMEPEPFVEEI
jgi:hypothetical protein